jgi:hypothetical protein
MLWEVDVTLTDPGADHAARDVVAGAAELGLPGCGSARSPCPSRTCSTSSGRNWRRKRS